MVTKNKFTFLIALSILSPAGFATCENPTPEEWNSWVRETNKVFNSCAYKNHTAIMGGADPKSLPICPKNEFDPNGGCTRTQ